MQRAVVSLFVAGQLSEHYGCGHEHAAQTFPHREDFIEVPVWGIQKAMEEAYLLGRMTR